MAKNLDECTRHLMCRLAGHVPSWGNVPHSLLPPSWALSGICFRMFLSPFRPLGAGSQVLTAVPRTSFTDTGYFIGAPENLCRPRRASQGSAGPKAIRPRFRRRYRCRCRALFFPAYAAVFRPFRRNTLSVPAFPTSGNSLFTFTRDSAACTGNRFSPLFFRRTLLFHPFPP